MRTGEVVAVMRAEGFELTPGYLDFLIRERHVPPPERNRAGYIWAKADIDRLRGALRRRGRGPAKRAGVER